MVVDDIMNRKINTKSRTPPSNPSTNWPFTDDKVIVGFDCEGINLGVKGQLTLLQIATMAGFAYVFDLISCPQMIEAGLRKILESPDVIKVDLFHFLGRIEINTISTLLFTDRPRLSQRFSEPVPSIFDYPEQRL